MNVFTQKEFDDSLISYGFFGRKGGVSGDLYDSLNVGFGAKHDARKNIDQNRERVAQCIGVPIERLLTVYQIHSAKCIAVQALWGDDDRPEADALVTDLPNIALGVLTADCAPVLFIGSKKNGESVIGAAHAGWRGAFGGVLQETARQMVILGAELNTIRACIGPCIARKSYEVSAAFFEQFIGQSEENERFFTSGRREGHPHFDLPGYCAAQLKDIGLQYIYIQGADTYIKSDDFFSCRRAAHLGEADYGRQISVISIVDNEK